MKKITAILIALAMLLSGCGKAPSESAIPADTRTVTDVWGRVVEIPQQVDSIICLGSMAPRFAAYLDAVDMLVGAEDHDIKSFTVLRDYNAAYFDTLKALPSVGAGGGSGQNNGYPEQIIGVLPDVIIAGFDSAACDELQRQTGIPVVSVRYRDNGFIDENFDRALNVFAEVIGKQQRAQQLLDFINGCKADLNSRTENIPDSEKQSVYTGAVTFNGRHGFGGTYVNFGPLMAVNAKNVADSLAAQQVGEAASSAAASGKAYLGSNGFDIDLEQVIKWDPDVILLDPGNIDLVNDEYKANPGFFDSLRAVKDGQVYTMPSFNNCGQNTTYALIDAYYAGCVLFPEQFADVNIEDKAAEILEFMVGKNIFADMQNGGLYYGKITIGG